MTNCDRCHQPTIATITSMFNTDTICLECKKLERENPRYAEAVAADKAAIRGGNFNFAGIGLPDEDEESAAQMLRRLGFNVVRLHGGTDADGK